MVSWSFVKVPLVPARYLWNQLMYFFNSSSSLTCSDTGHTLNIANMLLKNNPDGWQH